MSAKRPQSVRKASAIVRGGSDMPESPQSPKSSRNAELSSLVTFRITKVSTVTGLGGGSWPRNPELSSLVGLASGLCVSKASTVTGLGGVVVAKPRTVVTFGLASGLCVSKVSTVTGLGGGRGRETQSCRHFWTRLGSLRLKSVNGHRDRGGSLSRNPELSSLLDSPRVFASQKCQRSQGSGGRGRETQSCRHFWTRLGSFASQKRQRSQASGGGRGRETQNCRHCWTRLGSSRRGGRGRETQNCRHFWTRLGSLRLKSVNGHRPRGVVVAKPRTVVTFGLASGLCVSKASTVRDRGGSWSRNPELSSLLDSPRVFASQKCQRSQASGGSWSRNPELSSLLDSSRVFASQKCQQSR